MLAYVIQLVYSVYMINQTNTQDRMTPEPINSEIPLTAPYFVRDLQGDAIVYSTTYANRKRARNFAEKKNLEYGAHRYIATLRKMSTSLVNL